MKNVSSNYFSINRYDKTYVLCFRNIFATKLEQQSNVGNLKKKIRHFQFETRLKTANCAFEQKNVYVTRKYLNNIQEKVSCFNFVSNRTCFCSF